MEQLTLFGDAEPIERIKTFEEKLEHSKEVLRMAAGIADTYYHKPLIITYSGGKDSDVMLHLAMDVGIDFEVLHSVTTVDAPETNRHVNKVYRKLHDMGIKAEKSIPMIKNKETGELEKTNMWKLIVQKGMPPTRLSRYCCSVLKEASTPNRIVALGVRKAESVGRGGRSDFATRGKTYKDARFYSLQHTQDVFTDAKRIAEEYNKPVEEEDVYDCTMVKMAKENQDLICNPIYDWTDIEIWRYIRQNDIEVNPLYAKGFKRVGCIGCPMAGERKQKWEFSLYPWIKDHYIGAFDKMLEARRAKGKDDVTGKEGFHRWETGQDVYNWWVSDGSKDYYGQMNLMEINDD